jgi:hypothetical protein
VITFNHTDWNFSCKIRIYKDKILDLINYDFDIITDNGYDNYEYIYRNITLLNNSLLLENQNLIYQARELFEKIFPNELKE